MNNLTATTSLLTSIQFFLSFRPSSSLAELPLDEFALDRSVAETLSEQVLRPISSSVAAVATNRHDHLLVSSVVWENSLETVTEREEVALCSELWLKDFGFKLCARLVKVDALRSGPGLRSNQICLHCYCLGTSLSSFTFRTHRFLHKNGPDKLNFRTLFQDLLLLLEVIIDELCVVIVILLRYHLWLID